MIAIASSSTCQVPDIEHQETGESGASIVPVQAPRQRAIPCICRPEAASYRARCLIAPRHIGVGGGGAPWDGREKPVTSYGEGVQPIAPPHVLIAPLAAITLAPETAAVRVGARGQLRKAEYDRGARHRAARAQVSQRLVGVGANGECAQPPGGACRVCPGDAPGTEIQKRGV